MNSPGILVAAIVVAIVTVAAPASARNVDREEAVAAFEQRVLATKERLRLTDAQAPMVEEILMESAERRSAILEQYGVGDGEKPNLSLREKRKLGGELKLVSEDTLNKLSDILTDDQLREYKRFQEERRGEMREKLQSR